MLTIEAIKELIESKSSVRFTEDAENQYYITRDGKILAEEYGPDEDRTDLPWEKHLVDGFSFEGAEYSRFNILLEPAGYVRISETEYVCVGETYINSDLEEWFKIRRSELKKENNHLIPLLEKVYNHLKEGKDFDFMMEEFITYPEIFLRTRIDGLTSFIINYDSPKLKLYKCKSTF